MKKVLHVSTAHHPLDHRIFYKEATGLAANGYQVTLAATVDEPQMRNQVEFIPLGKYGGSRWRRISRSVRAVLATLTTSADLIHIHEPELMLAVLPALLAGKRLVYDIHEFYYQRLLDSDWVWPGARQLAARLYSAIERLLLPHFAGVVVVTEGMELMYRKRFPHTNISLVRNYPAMNEELRNFALSQKPPIGQPYIIHTGGAKRNKGFDIIVAVAESLRERGIQAPIVVVGPIRLSAFPSSERNCLLERAKAADVRLLGALDYAETLLWVAHARIGYALSPDTQIFRLALSTKLFEYFSMGLPVVTTSIGRMGELVDECHAGLVVAPDDVKAHADAFERLLADGDFARRAAQASAEAGRRFTFQSELDSLLNLYTRILGTSTD